MTEDEYWDSAFDDIKKELIISKYVDDLYADYMADNKKLLNERNLESALDNMLQEKVELLKEKYQHDDSVTREPMKTE